MKTAVIDTNIVLDLFIFSDPATVGLRAALAGGQLRWIATPVMRDELERVLGYPHILKRMQFYPVNAEAVLAQFDRQAQLQAPAATAPWICKDPDDQKFIDLAIAAQPSLLLSKDKAVLCMKKRLLLGGVVVQKAWVEA